MIPWFHGYINSRKPTARKQTAVFAQFRERRSLRALTLHVERKYERRTGRRICKEEVRLNFHSYKFRRLTQCLWLAASRTCAITHNQTTFKHLITRSGPTILKVLIMNIGLQNSIYKQRHCCVHCSRIYSCDRRITVEHQVRDLTHLSPGKRILHF